LMLIQNDQETVREPRLPQIHFTDEDVS